MAVLLAEAVPARVVVGYEPPTKQNRLTVAFRVILVIPHFLFFGILTIIATFAVMGGWFIALVAGRLPRGMHTFLSEVVRYGTRIYSYTMLLTDRYPPFSLGSQDFPISVEIPQARLNRAAVFFRLILQIPAYLLLTLVMYGMVIVGFFIWLIVLITGRMPRSVFEAVASTIRYQTRYYGYMALLSPAYPAGLFGDRGVEEPAPAAGTLPSGGTPALEWPSFPGVDIGADWIRPTTAAATPALWPEPPAPWSTALPAMRPRATTLVMSRAGKRLVVLFIVLGVLYWAGSAIAAFTASTTSSVLLDVEDAHGSLTDAVSQFQTQAASCRSQSDFGCLQAATRDLSTAFSDFGNQLASIDFPASAQRAAMDLGATTGEMTTFLDQLAASPSPQAYNQQGPQFQELGNQFDHDYQRLINALS